MSRMIEEAMSVVRFWDGKKLVCAKSREPRLDDARSVLTRPFSKRKALSFSRIAD
jgi:hypothetical protein